MRTLEEIRQFVAQEQGCLHWDALIQEVISDYEIVTFYCDAVATIYADQALDTAAEKVELEYCVYAKYREEEEKWDGLNDYGSGFRINKQSILQLKEQLK